MGLTGKYTTDMWPNGLTDTPLPSVELNPTEYWTFQTPTSSSPQVVYCRTKRSAGILQTMPDPPGASALPENPGGEGHGH